MITERKHSDQQLLWITLNGLFGLPDKRNEIILNLFDEFFLLLYLF